RILADFTSVLLSGSLDREAILQAIADFAVPRFADWCSIHLLQPDRQFRAFAVKHSDPQMTEKLREAISRWPAKPDQEIGHPYVIRTGKSLFIPEVTDQILQ